MSNDKISLIYGDIDESDIPVIINESNRETYSRITMVMSVFLAGIILCVYAISRLRLKSETKHVAAKLLSDSDRPDQCGMFSGPQESKFNDTRSKFNDTRSKFSKTESKLPKSNNPINLFKSKGKMHDLSDGAKFNLFKIPYINIIEISMPVDNFPNGFKCLSSFKFYIITGDKLIFEIASGWHMVGEMYVTRFRLPNLTKLYGIQIYVSPDIVPMSFKVIDIKLRDQNDHIIWKDISIVDLQSQDVSNGVIQDKYITIQFDLDKYV